MKKELTLSITGTNFLGERFLVERKLSITELERMTREQRMAFLDQHFLVANRQADLACSRSARDARNSS